MKRVLPLLLAIVLVTTVAPIGRAESGGFPRGVHPWPSGNEWPHDLDRSFEITTEHHTVAMDDGVELDGWIWRPDGLPDGVKSPTVLFFSPYNGNTDPPADDQDSPIFGAIRYVVPAHRLVSSGYAVAFFSVRGTGNSGGCYDWFGERTAEDGAALVDWLATREWSNGRVGMIGASEDATTAWATAIKASEALKTIVPMSGAIDRIVSYQGTPNGLWTSQMLMNGAGSYAVHGAPAIADQRATDPDAAARISQRYPLCEDVARMVERQAVDVTSRSRDGAFWGERRFTDRLPEVSSSVLFTAGQNDTTIYGFGAEAVGWELLQRAPKYMILGDWGHAQPKPTFPWDAEAYVGSPYGDWTETLIEWFDFWLMGIGDVPGGVGRVDYELGSNEWMTSSSWPPREVKEEAVYLSGGSLKAEPGGGTGRSFRDVPRAAAYAFMDSPIAPCDPNTLLYESSLVPENEDGRGIALAGTPHAYLKLDSTEAGGEVMAHLFDLGPDFSCDANPSAFSLMTYGGADLRFHDGSFEAKDFIDGTNVRIDMEAMARRIAPGHRIGVLVSAGDVIWKSLVPYVPEITVREDGGDLASHLVLPVVDDPSTDARETLGGSKPKVKYPPRPDLPR